MFTRIYSWEIDSTMIVGLRLYYIVDKEVFKLGYDLEGGDI